MWSDMNETIRASNSEQPKMPKHMFVHVKLTARVSDVRWWENTCDSVNLCSTQNSLSLYDSLPPPLQYSKEFSIHEYDKAETEPTETPDLRHHRGFIQIQHSYVLIDVSCDADLLHPPRSFIPMKASRLPHTVDCVSLLTVKLANMPKENMENWCGWSCWAW